MGNGLSPGDVHGLYVSTGERIELSAAAGDTALFYFSGACRLAACLAGLRLLTRPGDEHTKRELKLCGSVQRAIRLEHLHIVCSFKCGRFGAMLLTHRSDHLFDALVFVLVQPRDELVQYLSNPAHSSLQ